MCATLNKGCTGSLCAVLPSFWMLFVTASMNPGPSSIKSLFRVYVKFSLYALADDSRWHWF